MAKTKELEATIDTAGMHDFPGNASMFTFDPGGRLGGTYESGDFSLTSMAAAWFLRAQVTAWQDYTKSASGGIDYTRDALGIELRNMHLNMLDLAALRNLLVTAVGAIDSAHREEKAAYENAAATREHSLNGVPEQEG